MILDAGICTIYRVRPGRGEASPVAGLEPSYVNWYGLLRYESGSGAETGDITQKIRIHDADVAEFDIAVIAEKPWRITRVYHGVDDDNHQPIADVTLARGERHFVRAALVPRRVTTDALNTITGLPDTDNSRSVWVATGAVNADEYYAAEAVGHELSMRIEVYAADYADEPFVEYGETMYRVRRVERRGTVVNLVCEAMTAWHV